MPNNPGGGPPDKWEKFQLVAEPASDAILAALNNSDAKVTAAFTQQCLDGLFLFLGFYKDKE